MIWRRAARDTLATLADMSCALAKLVLLMQEAELQKHMMPVTINDSGGCGPVAQFGPVLSIPPLCEPFEMLEFTANCPLEARFSYATPWVSLVY